MKVNVLKFGGRGVDVALTRGPKSWGGQEPGTNTVFWSEQRWRPSDRPGYPDEPAGGYNSFVCVADPERGYWKTADGQRVTLVSINGIGEIRWRIDGSHMEHYAEGSIEHFGLVPFK